jgi:hypothetical protein
VLTEGLLIHFRAYISALAYRWLSPLYRQDTCCVAIYRSPSTLHSIIRDRNNNEKKNTCIYIPDIYMTSWKIGINFNFSIIFGDVPK